LSSATATPEDDNRVGSVGKPMRGAEIRIVEPDKDGVGEVQIRGSMVFDGYYRNPQATADAFAEDGWFRSGDLGKLDKDGFLYIVGRAKDVIVLPSGKNVHPEDLEVHYLKCPMVGEMAVIGVEDKSETHAGAEKLAAVVVPDFEYLKQAKIANSKEAIRHALDSLGRELPEYQRVRDYIIRVEPLPRTATNKVKRFQLKKEVESGVIATEAKETKGWEFTPADQALMDTPAARSVVAAIAQNAGSAEAIHPAMNLEIDLGLDSLARAETFAALEHAYSTEFAADEAAEALTVASVVELVNKHGGASGEEVAVELNWGNIVREADDEFPEIKAVLEKKPLFSPFAFFVYKIFYIVFKVFLRLEVKGLENLHTAMDGTNGSGKSAETGVAPFLICPNHQSFLDPFVLCSNYPYKLFRNSFHVGASEFFANALMRFIAKMLNVVPVNPDTELMRAMKAGAIGLKHGKVLNIYPEGERAFDGELHGFKKGAAILARELDLPIVPVALDGLYNVWARGTWRIRPSKVKITVGEPFYARDVLVNAPDDATDEDSYALITDHLKQTIAAMIAEMRSPHQLIK